MQVVEQGLTPDMAIRACCNASITSSILSRELKKVISARAQVLVDDIRKADDNNTNEVTGEDVSAASTAASMSTFNAPVVEGLGDAALAAVIAAVLAAIC